MLNEELFKRAIDRSEEYLKKLWPFTGCKRSKVGHFRKEVKKRRRRNKLARLSRRRYR